MKNEFEKYVQEYGDSLSRLCYSLCRNREDAHDLYQDTWLKAYNAYKKVEVKSFDKWLYSICTNCFRDTYRKRLRGVQEVQFDSNEHKDSFLNSIACDEYDEKDYSLLYNAINKLPNKLKETISLRYFSDLSCNDIAEILGISLSAVTTRLSRAIKQLATEMNREERR